MLKGGFTQCKRKVEGSALEYSQGVTETVKTKLVTYMPRLQVEEKSSESPRLFLTKETAYHRGIEEFNRLSKHTHIHMYTRAHKFTAFEQNILLWLNRQGGSCKEAGTSGGQGSRKQVQRPRDRTFRRYTHLGTAGG